jgi:hypothetical protein
MILLRNVPMLWKWLIKSVTVRKLLILHRLSTLEPLACSIWREVFDKCAAAIYTQVFGG